MPEQASAQRRARLLDDDELELRYNALDGQQAESGSHGLTWCLGAAFFVSGFFVNTVYVWGSAAGMDFDPHGISKAVYAVVQTGGLVAMAVSDVDINEYLRNRPRYIACFAIAWAVPFVVGTYNPSVNVKIGSSIVSLPFIYTLVRFKQIAAMRAGFLPFSELMMLGLVLFTTVDAMIFLTVKPVDLGAGISFLAGAAFMVGAYYWSRQKYQSLTGALTTGILFFLLQYGFNWLLWECFVPGFFYQKEVPIGDWLFGFIHFIAAVYMLALRNESHYKLPLGLALFVFGFLAAFITEFEQETGNFQRAGWLFLLSGMLQTGGLLTMTLADTDANFYMKKHTVQSILIAGSLVATQGFAALQPPRLPIMQVWWVSCLPWLYFAIRFQQVSEMHDGFLRFTDLFVAFLILELLADTALLLADMVDASTTGIACLALSGTALTLTIAYQFAGNRQSATVQMHMVAYAYLFTQGFVQLVAGLLDVEVYHTHGDTNATLTTQGWFFIPVHLVPTAAVLCFYNTIHRKIGRKWLELRLTRESSEDDGRDRVTSDLGWLAAVEEDITTGADLNDYVEHVNDDEYTRLLLACWATKHDAVQRLLTYDGQKVDIDKASKEQGWSPLFVAAHNGDLQLAKMLLEYGAAVEQRTNDGQSPLFIASARKHTDVCSLLIEHGANASGGDRWMGLSPQELLPISRKQQQQRGTGEGSEVVGRGWGGDSRGNSYILESRDSSGLESTLDGTLDGSCIDSALESGARSTGTDSMSSRPSSRSSMASRPTGASGTSSLAGDEGREGSFGSGRSSL
jgi:hypothetical protein